MTSHGDGAPLVSFVNQFRGEIVEDWAQIACRLPASAELTLPALVDHIPALIDQIAEVAERIANGEPDAQPGAATKHVLERVAEGFELSEIVTELSILRRCILAVWGREHPHARPGELLALEHAIDRAIVLAVKGYEDRFRRAAEDREAIHAEIGSLLGAAPIGIAFLDRDLRYVRVNRALAEINGRSVEDHLGRTVREVLPAIADRLEPVLSHTLTTGEPTTLELTGEPPSTPGVTRSFVASFFPVRARTGVLGVGCTVTEVSDTKRTQEQLQAALRSREELLAIVSHDLRNPLGTIVLGTAMLGAQLVEGPARKHLDRIERAAHSMETMLGDLLDTGSIQAGRLALAFADVRAADLVNEALDRQRPLAEDRELRLVRELDLDDVVLRCDRERILQVFGNVLGNAIKFCNPGDTITIRGGLVGDYVRIEVADTGPGIAPEVLPQLFQPFFSAAPDHAKRGSGLGLYICKGIVDGHGGQLSVESTVGRGTTFSFTLPIAR